jgi:hypothetical protein
MKRTFVLTLLLLFNGVASAQEKAHPTPTPRCDESLWKQVFTGDSRRFDSSKSRLKIIDACITVTGNIVAMRPEEDGDIHILLRLDPGQSQLLNAKNRSGQKGNLVIEPICTKAPTGGSALKQRVCRRFRQNFAALTQVRANIKKKKPTHVEVTGLSPNNRAAESSVRLGPQDVPALVPTRRC